MKTLICYALVGAASLLSGPNLFADITGTGTLTISAPGLPDVNGPYNVVTKTDTSGPNLGTFETFCLGSQVDYYSGDTYNYQISTNVQPFAAEGGGGLRYVALGTAWLYSQYVAGDLGSGTLNNSTNDALQLAIWYLQGQSGGADNSFVTNAINNVGLSDLTNNADGEYGVYALDLSVTNSSETAPGDVSGYAQPELCLIPPQSQGTPPPSVPEPGTIFAGAMLLFPLALSTVRILRKSKKDV